MKYKFGKVFLPSIEDWLISLKLDEWYDNFLVTGFDNMESILLSMFSNEPVDEKLLEEEIGIYERDARILIYSKLIEGNDPFWLLMKLGWNVWGSNF